MTEPVYAKSVDVYRQRGWTDVVPLPAGQKFPPPSGYTGTEAKTPTAAQIEVWKRTEPAGNLALHLPDGFVGLDVDHYGAKTGGDTLAAHEEAWGSLPATWVSTAREGLSGIRLYRVATGTKLVGEIGDDIEVIQHHHRYVCAWPSTNPKAGGARYHWHTPDGLVADRPPRPEELPELPALWVEGLTKRKAVANVSRSGPTAGGDLDRAALEVEMAPAGRGNPVLNGTAYHEGRLVGAGVVDKAEAEAALVAAAVKRGGETEERALAIVRSGMEAGEAKPASYFTERGQLVTARIGEAIRRAGNLRTGADGRLYRYDSGVYRGDGDVWARAKVRELLGDRVTRNHFSEVSTWLHSFPPTVYGRPATETINVANGLLDWRTGELRPHDPDFISTVQIPVAWDPGAKCPRTEQFLMEVFPTDAVEIAGEVMGYALYAGNPYRKAVLLLGSGGNGKSKYLAIVSALLGPANVASVPVQVFGEHRFAAAELFGKLANVAGDLDARAIKRSDVFKMITGGDPIMAERKNCHPFSFVSFALPLFSANEPPISSDQTQAWFDRWLILPMENRIEGTAKCDPFLEAKLTSPAELAGALVLAVDGLRRLMDRGGFAEPESVRSAGEQYRDRLDSARGFVAESCVLHVDAWTPRSGLYKAYRHWCQDSGKFPVSAENFNARLRADYPAQVEERGRNGIRGWSGVGLLAAGVKATDE